MARNSSSDTTRSLSTLVFVVFGVVYVATTLLWMWATTSNQLIFDNKFDESMSKFGEFFAIVAAPLWYFTTLNQMRYFRGRVIALSIGALVLFPFPLFVGVSPL